MYWSKQSKWDYDKNQYLDSILSKPNEFCKLTNSCVLEEVKKLNLNNVDTYRIKKMIDYCEQDVVLLEDVYTVISPYIYHNTNFAVLKGGKKWHCPECASDNVQLSHTDATAMGVIRRHMKCNKCRKFFKVSNKTYLHMLEHLMRNK